MKNNHKYIFVIILFIGLKLLFSKASTIDLVFLLKPTDTLVSLISSSSGIWTENGYFHQDLNILINKSCSGYNFWLIGFIMLSFLSIQKEFQFSYSIPIILLLTYLFSILVNSSRIVILMRLEYTLQQNLNLHLNWLHQAGGAFIYLLFLIISYLSFDYLTSISKATHEKLS
jgi:exosortase K